MFYRIIRRAALPLLTGGMLAAGVGMAASPAHASGLTNCSGVGGGMEYASGYVVAEKYRICDDGTERPNPVSIQRQNPTTLVWTTVASGNGTTSYHCQGTAIRRYRMNGTGTGVAYPCT